MDPKKLRKKYMEVMPKLTGALEQLKGQLSDMPPSDFQVETGLKPYPSTKRKMVEERIKNPLELKDLVRGRIYFSDQFELKDVMEIIKQLFGKKIVKSDNKDTNNCGLEYTGITDVNLDMDGIPCELQVMPAALKPHQEISHQIYDQLRNPKSKLSDEEKEFLRHRHNKLFQASVKS
jgi:hypothetical protein